MTTVHRLAPDPTDDNVRAGLLSASYELDFAAGRYRQSARQSREMAAANALNAPQGFLNAARASILARDAASATKDLEAFAVTGAHGPELHVRRDAIRAGIEALTGSRDVARMAYADVLARLEAMNGILSVALTGMMAATTLGPDDPVASAAAARSREILEGLGARALLQRLDDALSGERMASAAG